jgi:hypothetical protein
VMILLSCRFIRFLPSDIREGRMRNEVESCLLTAGIHDRDILSAASYLWARGPDNVHIC